MAEAPHKYLHAFIAEATEHLEQLASELVRIEQEPPGGPLWDSIFRRVHSVKGSAATIGLPTIVEIAHVAETLIGKLKAQRRRPEQKPVAAPSLPRRNAAFSLARSCQAPGARALRVKPKLRGAGTLLGME